ncbi:MAG: ATP-binding protein [Bacteroidota bacterium]
MIERLLAKKILRDLAWSPIVGLIGSRQVGKTTLAKSLQSQLRKPSIYLDLELDTDRYKLQEAEHYLTQHEEQCIIIDEVQILPSLFALLRAIVDQRREAGRFILLGSAAPHIVKLNTETLAGRIVYHELSPFSYTEIKNRLDWRLHWLRGGLPNALLAEQSIIARKWMSDFVETFVHRDLARLGFSISSQNLRNLLSMLAHIHGDLLNVSRLSKSLGVSTPTVNKYLELLEGSFLIRRLPPYFHNISKRLTKSPKLYLQDTGLLHHLLRIYDHESLLGHPALGNSWEGYVIEQIIREAPEFSDFYFYRTQAGAEVDLLMITPSGKKAIFEIKFSTTPKLTKGFYEVSKDLSPDYSYVITPSGATLERENGVKVIAFVDFLEQELIRLQ